jgi:hypothetical protein
VKGSVSSSHQALYVISNLALGNERTRNVIVGRLEVIELLSKALVSLDA